MNAQRHDNTNGVMYIDFFSLSFYACYTRILYNHGIVAGCLPIYDKNNENTFRVRKETKLTGP